MTQSLLLSRCIFSHGDMLRTRDEQGYLALECADCGKTTRLFQQPVIKGPPSTGRTSTATNSSVSDHYRSDVAAVEA